MQIGGPEPLGETAIDRRQELTGFDVDEVRGRPLWDTLLVPEEVEAVKRVFYSLLEGLLPNTFENYWRCKGGDRRLISWYNTAVHAPGAKRG